MNVGWSARDPCFFCLEIFKNKMGKKKQCPLGFSAVKILKKLVVV
jgi:hypothetical protein